MKKRIVSLILIGAMAISLCACGDSNNSSSSNTESNASTQTISSPDESSASSGEDDGLPKGDKDLIKSWGIAYNPRTEGAAYYINVPRPGGKDNLHSTVPDEGYSYLMEEKDPPYGKYALDVDKIEDIRSTYEKMIFARLKSAEEFSTMVENQKMTEDSTENIKVNEYEICVTKGTYSCDVMDKINNVLDYSTEYPYICYSTFLTTGTPVFWVLIDQSEDKSKGDEMEETAMNMAKTLREFDPDDPMSEKEARGEE